MVASCGVGGAAQGARDCGVAGDVLGPGRRKERGVAQRE